MSLVYFKITIKTHLFHVNNFILQNTRQKVFQAPRGGLECSLTGAECARAVRETERGGKQRCVK